MNAVARTLLAGLAAIALGKPTARAAPPGPVEITLVSYAVAKPFFDALEAKYRE